MIPCKNNEAARGFLNKTLPDKAAVDLYVLEDGTTVKPRSVTEAGEDGYWNRLGIKASLVVGSCHQESVHIVLVEWPEGSLSNAAIKAKVSHLKAIRLVDRSEIVACE